VTLAARNNPHFRRRGQGGGAVPANVVCVDQTATGAADGTSWADACTTLAAAYAIIKAAYPARDTVWCAKDQTHTVTGSHRPVGLGLYGGFAGEVLADDRSASARTTITRDSSGVLIDINSANADYLGASFALDQLTLTRTVGADVLVSVFGFAKAVTANRCDLDGNSLAQYGFTGQGALTLTRCTLRDMARGGVYKGGAYAVAATACAFSGCPGMASGNGSASAIETDQATSVTLRDCLIHDCANINTVSNQGAMIRNSRGGTHLLVNCTFANCTRVGAEESIYEHYTAVGVTLRNCLVYPCDTPLYSLVVAKTNTLDDGTDPKFVGAADYRLQAASPCINAGDDAYVTTSTDLDGNTRSVGAAVDQGAYEYQG